MNDEAIRAAAVKIAHILDCTTPLSVGDPMIKQFEAIIKSHCARAPSASVREIAERVALKVLDWLNYDTELVAVKTDAITVAEIITEAFAATPAPDAVKIITELRDEWVKNIDKLWDERADLAFDVEAQVAAANEILAALERTKEGR